MPITREEYGLCKTCKNNGNCTYRSAENDGQPILYCEEAEPIEGVQERIIPVSPPVKREILAYPETPENADHRSLCFNCENRQNCTYPKPEGGVWHCQEYR